ncbi:MAG TPA: type VI secretion system baseplate subunit TssE [Polyangiales bacterium]|nr:type VI secretion system baseplate subunit TssE [Polyangiales bacterium]
MPELVHKERLQPSLLDRLTDDEPGEQQESRDKRVLSPVRLRESALRDLGWLFNTTQLSATQDLNGCPEVAKSVLNYGLPDLAGRTVSGIDIPRFEALLKQAIWDFEPRLLRNTISLRLIVNEDEMSHNAMSFIVEAELWSQPIPLQLYLRTEVDLEDGDFTVRELTNRRGEE